MSRCPAWTKGNASFLDELLIEKIFDTLDDACRKFALWGGLRGARSGNYAPPKVVPETIYPEGFVGDLMRTKDSYAALVNIAEGQGWSVTKVRQEHHRARATQGRMPVMSKVRPDG